MAQQLSNSQTLWKILGMAENIPLFFMVGVGVTFSAYSAYRSSTTATDLIWNTQRRDYLRESIDRPGQIVSESEQHYNRGWLRALSKVRGYAHVIPDVGVPKGEHAHS